MPYECHACTYAHAMVSRGGYLHVHFVCQSADEVDSQILCGGWLSCSVLNNKLWFQLTANEQLRYGASIIYDLHETCKNTTA